VDECGDMERLDLNEFVNLFGGAPVGEAASRVHIGPSGMSVVDLSGKKLEDPPGGFRCGREKRGRLKVRRRRYDQVFWAVPCRSCKHVIKDVITR